MCTSVRRLRTRNAAVALWWTLQQGCKVRSSNQPAARQHAHQEESCSLCRKWRVTYVFDMQSSLQQLSKATCEQRIYALCFGGKPAELRQVGDQHRER